MDIDELSQSQTIESVSIDVYTINVSGLDQNISLETPLLTEQIGVDSITQSQTLDTLQVIPAYRGTVIIFTNV